MSTTPLPTSPRWPRETRDTWLILGAVALVLLPQVPHLPLWTSVLAYALLAWRGWQAWRQRALPRPWVTGALLALSVGATLAQFRSIVGPEAGVVLVTLLLVLKTLEMRARRDAMVIFFLGFFTLLTLFLHSQSLTTAAAMGLALWALLATLVNAHRPAGYPRVGELLRTAGALLAWSAPLMLVLFLTFPRLPPLWGLPTATDQGRTGLSNDMTVGDVSTLAQDSSVALRVRFTGAVPARHQLYFRGPVLGQFDGRHWQALAQRPQALPASPSRTTLAPNSVATGYEVTLEPHRQRWLLTLDATVQPPRGTPRPSLPTRDLQWLMPRPITDVLRYQAEAHLHYRDALPLPPQARQAYVQLPPHSAPRTRAWAQQLRAQAGSDDRAVVAAALQQLRQGGYTYTLSPGRSVGDATDHFWFDHRQGFCEHIASAFTVLLRAAGIPARIVTGYQGGELNPVDGLWTVRHSDAHAWTEVWLPGQGWQRVDPTSAVAPSRTTALQRLAPPATLWGDSVRAMVTPQLLQRLRATWEATNHRWNDWVLNYTGAQQQNLLQTLGLARWNLAHSAAALAVGVLAALALRAGLRRWQARPHDPWLRLMAAARRRLQALGVPGATHASPRQLAQAVQQRWGTAPDTATAAASVVQWLLHMEQWRYAAPGADTPSLRSLQRHYRSLRWPPG